MKCLRCDETANPGKKLGPACIAKLGRPVKHIGVTRQFAWQERQKVLGRCIVCGARSKPFRRCERHRAMERERRERARARGAA